MKNHNGIAHLLVLLLVVGALVIGGIGGYVMKQNNRDQARLQNQDKIAKADKITAVTESTESKAVALPADEPESTTVESKPATKPITSTKTTTKTPPPPPEGSVSISEDGCLVTVTGKSGMAVTIGSFSDKKGGESSYTIPESGKLTEKSGGIKGMTAYGKIYNSAGEKIAYSSRTITAENCF